MVPEALREIKETQLTAFTYSVVADGPLIGRKRGRLVIKGEPAKGQLYKHTSSQFNAGLEDIKDAEIPIATSAADIENAKKNGKKTALLAIEGGDFAEGKMETIEEFHKKGVRVIQPVHKRGNQFADSQEHELHGDGLSDAGKEFVKELDRLGIVNDVSHMTEDALEETAEITTKPLVLSHVIYPKGGAGFRRFKRWASTSYAKMVVETGGVLGVWNMTDRLYKHLGYGSGKEMFVGTFRYLADEYGVDHVALGSDVGSTPGWFDSYERLPDLADELKTAGFNDEEIGKMLGGNILRVIRKVTGG